MDVTPSSSPPPRQVQFESQTLVRRPLARFGARRVGDHRYDETGRCGGFEDGDRADGRGCTASARGAAWTYANDAILRMVGRSGGRTVDPDEHRSGTADVNVRCGVTREARSDRLDMRSDRDLHATSRTANAEERRRWHNEDPSGYTIAASPHKPPVLPGAAGSIDPIARNTFQLPSGSFLNTASTVPRACFVSPPGESTYEAV